MSTGSRKLRPLSMAGGAFRSYAPTGSAIPPSAPLLTQLCNTQTGLLWFPSKSYISPYNRWIKGCLPSIHLSKFNPFFKTSVKSTSSLLRLFLTNCPKAIIPFAKSLEHSIACIFGNSYYNFGGFSVFKLLYICILFYSAF